MGSFLMQTLWALLLGVCCRSYTIEFLEDVYSSNDVYLSWNASNEDGQTLQYRKCGETDFKAAAVQNISTPTQPDTFAATLSDLVPNTVYELQFAAGDTNLYRVRTVSASDDWQSYLQEIELYLEVGAAAAAVGLGAVILEPLALDLLGFGAVGITADSLAALIQSEIGDVEAGSVFSLLQSAGMTADTSSASFLGLSLRGIGIVSALSNLFEDECGNDGLGMIQHFFVMNVNNIDLNEIRNEISNFLNDGAEFIAREADEFGHFVWNALDDLVDVASDASKVVVKTADDIGDAVSDAASDTGKPRPVFVTADGVGDAPNDARKVVVDGADYVADVASDTARDIARFLKHKFDSAFRTRASP